MSVAMADFEKVQGFVSRNEKRTIVCNRVGDAKTDRNYADGDLAAGCSFKIKMTPQVKLAKYLPSKKWSYTDVWTEPVRIDNFITLTKSGSEGRRCNSSFSRDLTSGLASVSSNKFNSTVLRT